MIYYLDGSVLDKTRLRENEFIGSKPCIGILGKDEVLEWKSHLGIENRLLTECMSSQSSKFESHEGFDYICLQIPDHSDLIGRESRISIFLKSNLLVFICDDDCEYFKLSDIINKIKLKEIKILTLERVLYEFFDELTAHDSLFLQTLEQEITDLEESLITSGKRDYIKEIIILRKKLLVLKRYYDQLFDLAEAMEENENELLSKKILRYYHILTTRIERLSDSVSNLRDYVSQVREAYQAQVDINQNEIMRLFTVITAIFLPLTLIVGWYGMNLQMPEYKWSFSYPVVITVSLAVALFSIIYFKKHKWF